MREGTSGSWPHCFLGESREYLAQLGSGHDPCLTCLCLRQIQNFVTCGEKCVASISNAPEVTHIQTLLKELTLKIEFFGFYEDEVC